MIWHIFRKDLRRLWPFVAGLGLINFAHEILLGMTLGQSLNNYPVLAQILPILGLVISGIIFFLVVVVVQLDPIPDDRQDWLARPISRWDLLLAKVLFVIVCIHGPMFAAGIAEGLVFGFSFGQSVVAAAAWNAHLFVNVSSNSLPGTLPALVLAAATQSIGQMLALGLAAGAGTAIAALGIAYAIYGDDLGTMRYQFTLSQWIFSLAVLLAGTAAILGLQYFRRATIPARIVVVTGVFFLWASFLLPSQGMALAVQSWFSSAPGQSVSISFAPDAPRHAVSAAGSSANDSFLLSKGYTPIYLPLRVTNEAPDLTLIAEDINATFTATDGKTATAPAILNMPLHVPGQPDAPTPLYQVLWVPPEFYPSHADQPVRVDVDIVLGILKPQGTYELAPNAGTIHTPEGVWCSTSFGNFSRGVRVTCEQANNLAMRTSAFLLDHASGLRNPTAVRFLYSEAPYPFDDGMITRFGPTLPFRDAATGTDYPVGAAQLKTSSVVLSVSKPLTHVMRRVTISDIRLSQWKAEVGNDQKCAQSPGSDALICNTR